MPNELELTKCTNSYKYFIETYLSVQLSDDDIAFMDSLISERYHIVASSEKSNNTLLMHLLVLWKLLFKATDGTYVITTPLLKHAEVYNKRFRLYYNMLPDWMKITSKENKRYLRLSNNNAVIFSALGIDCIHGIAPTEMYIHGVAFMKRENINGWFECFIPILCSLKSCKIVIESYPFLNSYFNELWNSDSYTKHGKIEYRYPLREGIENGF